MDPLVNLEVSRPILNIDLVSTVISMVNYILD